MDERVVQVFISSPSDVRPERLIAERVIRRLNREFIYHFRVEPVLWERKPLVAGRHFQEGIISPDETDIVVVILWSRLGVKLPQARYRGALSGRAVTGTEWEFENALASFRVRATPEILLYRKRASVTAALDNEPEVQERLRQMQALEEFVRQWFVDAETKEFTTAFRDFVDTAEFEELFEGHLRELLRRRIERQPEQGVVASVRWHKGSPWRGLAPFDFEFAPLFFGRTRARNELRELLARRASAGPAFVLVMGASGSGKSSLVKAGLLPDLMMPGMIERVALCRRAVMRPSDAPGAPMSGLARALVSLEALPELVSLQYDAKALAALLTDAPNQAALPIRQGLARAGEQADLTAVAEARLIIVIDQLEELFTDDKLTSSSREAFVEALAVLARTGFVWVLATMRSDFFDRLETSPALTALSAGDARYLLAPPDETELSQIVRGPAREAGLRFEVDDITGEPLDEAIRLAAARHPGALPLLSFVLDQLWAMRTLTGVLTFAAYRELGGLEGALGRRAEQQFQSLPEDVRNALPIILRALVTVGEGQRASITARPARMASFRPGSPERRLIDAFLAPEARLFVADDGDHGASVRLAHEALLTHWGRAREQIVRDRRDLQLRSRLEQTALLWQFAREADRPSLLLRQGLPLSEAEDLLARRRAELDPNVITFVEQSGVTARAEARRRSRSLQGAAAVLGVLAVVASVGAFMGYRGQQAAYRGEQAAREAASGEAAARREAEAEAIRAEQRSREAEISQLDAQRRQFTAILLLADERLAAKEIGEAGAILLYAQDKFAKAPFPEERAQMIGKLYKALSIPGIAARLQLNSEAEAIALTPERTDLLIAEEGGQLSIWDPAAGVTRAMLQLGDGKKATEIFVAPDGRFAAVVRRDASVTFVDLSARRVTGTIQAKGKRGRVTAKPLTGMAAVVSRGGSTEIFDMSSGARLHALEAHLDPAGVSDHGGLILLHAGHKATLFDVTAGRPVHEFQANDQIAFAGLAKGGTLAWLIDRNGRATIQDLLSGQLLRTIELDPRALKDEQGRASDRRPFKALVSRDGRRLVLTDIATIRMWDLETGQMFPALHDGAEHGDIFAYWLGDFRFLDEGRRLLTWFSADGGPAIIWDAEKGTALTEIEPRTELQFDVRAIDEEGGHLLVRESDGREAIISIWTGRQVLDLGNVYDRSLFGLIGISSVLRHNFLAQTDGYEVVLWRFPDRRFGGNFSDHFGSTSKVAYAEGADLFGTADENGMISVWGADTSSPIARLNLSEEEIKQLALSSDGLFVFARTREDARVLRLPSGEAVLQIDPGEDGFKDKDLPVAFSPQNGAIAVAYGSKITVRSNLFPSTAIEPFSPEPGKYRRKGAEIAFLAFSASGLLAAAGTSGDVALVDMQTGDIRRRYVSPSYVHNIRWSPRGDILAVVSGEELLLVDANQPEPLWVVRTEGRYSGIGRFEASSVAFSPDGTLIAVVDGESMLRVWKVATGEQMFETRLSELREIGTASLAFITNRVLGANQENCFEGYDAELAIFDLNAARELFRARGTGASCGPIGVSPNGLLIHADGSVSIISTHGEIVVRLPLGPGFIQQTSDGRYLTRSSLGKLFVHPVLPPDQITARARASFPDVIARARKAELSIAQEFRGVSSPPVVQLTPPPPANACDELASHPYDLDRRGLGVDWDSLDATAAVTECRATDSRDPENARYAFQLGRALLKAEEFAEAQDAFAKAAVSGYRAAFASLAAFYQDGRGARIDFGKAIELLRDGAGRGDPRAIWELGESYNKGMGVPKDPNMGLELMNAAVAAGYASGYCVIGAMLLEGKAVPRDVVLGLKWLRSGAAAGEQQCRTRFVAAMREGLGTQGDNAAALELLERAAALGDPSAAFDLATMYFNGQGVAQDVAKAIQLAEAAAAARFAPAYLALARYYSSREAIGGPFDEAKAFFWAKVAEQLGSPEYRSEAKRLADVLRIPIGPSEASLQEHAASTFAR